MSNKYSNILTMLLVVFIVAILGIVVYFGYSILNSNKVNSNAQATIDEFENATKKVKKDTSNLTNTTEDEETTAENPLDQLTEMEGTQSSETTEDEIEKVYMEDYEVMGTIAIPKTGIEYPILENVTKRSLEIAVGIAYGPGYNGVGNLNEAGNTVIYGHNYRNGLFFSNNKKLSTGDIIYITDKYGEKVTYTIYNIYQTDANDASYFTRDTEGRREISLQTCTDDSSARIIIWASAD
jgi:LPXTG-site transpeptidase (sortase) family protein